MKSTHPYIALNSQSVISPTFKLFCPQHNEQILKVCTKISCKNKRFLCRYCLTSSNHRKHLTQHPQMEAFSQVLSAIDTPDIIKDILTNASKYFTFLLNDLSKAEGQFKKRYEQIYEGMLKSSSYFNGFQNKLLELSKTQSQNQQKNCLLKILNFPRIKCDGNMNKTNFAKFVLFIKRQISETLLRIIRSNQILVDNFTLRPNIFTNSVRFLQHIQISNQQDLKRLKQSSFTNHSLSISFPREPQPNYNIDIIMKKISVHKIKQLSLSLTNLSSKDVLKIDLPVDCKSFSFVMKRKIIDKVLIHNLKKITEQWINNNLGRQENHLQRISIDLLQSNIHKENIVSQLSSWISMFSSTKELKLNLKLNRISKLGIFTLMAEISKLSNIQTLDMDFGGFGETINNLQGAMQMIGLSIRRFLHLRQLKLSLSNTNLNNKDILLLANQLLELKKLEKLDLGIQINQGITEIDQFIYKLSFCRMRSLVLRLNGIQVKNPKLYFIIESFNESSYLKDLAVEAKNCNVFKEETMRGQKGEKYRLSMSIIY